MTIGKLLFVSHVPLFKISKEGSEFTSFSCLEVLHIADIFEQREIYSSALKYEVIHPDNNVMKDPAIY